MHSLAKFQIDEPLTKKTRTKNVKSRKRSAEERTRWKRQDFSSKTVYCEKYEKLEKENPAAWIADNDLTPFKVFEVLFGNNFERIRKETERYAQRRGNSDFSLSLAEVKCAVGILILSGYHRLPSRRNYWEQKPDMLTKIASDNIRRNRFEKIIQFLHVADSRNLPEDTKIGCVLECLDGLQKNFKTNCIWDREFDIDQCMVEYFGRYGTFLKQSIRMKPIRFGYKI